MFTICMRISVGAAYDRAFITVGAYFNLYRIRTYNNNNNNNNNNEQRVLHLAQSDLYCPTNVGERCLFCCR